MGTENRIGHYPFTADEDPAIIHLARANALHELLDKPLFNRVDREEIADAYLKACDYAEEMFAPEAEARSRNEDGANLYYHNVSHAVHQSPHDGTIIFKNILERENKMPSNISRESVFGGLIGFVFHDLGFVYGAKPGENYAARAKKHVEISIKALNDYISRTNMPGSLDFGKVRYMATVAIEATKFPYTEELEAKAKRKFAKLDPKDRKEARIVRLAARVADLGGQIARVDYFPVHLPNLRLEMDCEEPGKGTSLIGKDNEITEKCHDFMENVIRGTIGKGANALLGSPNNAYAAEWEKLSKIASHQ